MSDRNILIIMMGLCLFGFFSIFICGQCNDDETCEGWCYPIVYAFFSFVCAFTLYYVGSTLFLHLKEYLEARNSPVTINIFNQTAPPRNESSSEDDNPERQLISPEDPRDEFDTQSSDDDNPERRLISSFEEV